MNRYYDPYQTFTLFGKVNDNNLEHFLGSIGIKGGNTTNLSDSTEINKKMNLKTNIDRSMVVKSTQKLINNVANSVSQKNSTDVMNASAASNSALFNGIECDTLNITDINQDATAQSGTSAVSFQKSQSNIKQNISNDIKKKISNALPNNIDSIQNKENEMMKQFMNATPGLDPNKAKNLLSGVSNDGFGNKTNISTSYKLNADLKKELNLNDSFKVDDNDEVSNTISNAISQKNMAKCAATAMAANNFTLNDVKCKTGNISKIKQKAASASTLSCAFSQENVNKISTKIMNKLDKTFTRMYGAAKDDDSKRRIAAMSYALGEAIRNASGLKPQNSGGNSNDTSSSSGNNKSSNDSSKQPISAPVAKLPAISKGTSDDSDNDTDNNSSTNTEKKSTNKDSKKSTKDNKSSKPNKSKNVDFLGMTVTSEQKNYLIYGGVGLLVLIIILVAYMMTSSKNSDDDE